MPNHVAMPRLRGTDARGGPVGPPMPGGSVTSDETIHKVAAVIAGKTTELGSSTMRGLDRATLAARALAEAGLLAPAPLTEEWGVRWGDPDEVVWDHYPGHQEATAGAEDEGAVVRRYFTDWATVDRAEGDGSADTC